MLTRQGWLVGIGAARAPGRRPRPRAVRGVRPRRRGHRPAARLRASSCACRGSSSRSGRDRCVPARVHVGQRSRVELTVRNHRRRRTPVLRLRDPVSGTRGRRPRSCRRCRPSERSVAAYRLPTDRRGHRAASARCRWSCRDPFGLVDLATAAAPAGAAHRPAPRRRRSPRCPTPPPTIRRPASASSTRLGRTGEEFYALRPYVVGDDLRRVHWPQSRPHRRAAGPPERGAVAGPHHGAARHARRRPHHGESLEVAVSAAASVVAATARRQDLVRLVTTAGSTPTSPRATTTSHALMEHLAVVPTSPGADLGRAHRRAPAAIQRRRAGGRRGRRARRRPPGAHRPPRPLRLGDGRAPRPLRLGPPGADRPLESIRRCSGSPASARSPPPGRSHVRRLAGSRPSRSPRRSVEPMTERSRSSGRAEVGLRPLRHPGRRGRA